ncbi:unnamed protein product [Caenorhabditis brenneri]
MAFVPSETFYVVERILNHRKTRKGKQEFLIKWADYDESHNSWEPKSNIADPLLIPAYFEARKQEEQEKKRLKAVAKKAPPPPPARRPPPTKAKTAPVRQRLAGGEIRPDSDSEEEQEASSSAAAAKKASEEEEVDSEDSESPVPKKKKRTVVEKDDEEEEEEEEEREPAPEPKAPEDKEVVELKPDDAAGPAPPAAHAIVLDHPPAPEARAITTNRPEEAEPAPRAEEEQGNGNDPEIIELDDDHEEEEADEEEDDEVVFIEEQPAQHDPVDPRIVHFPYDRLGRPIPNSSVAITETFIWPPDNVIPDVEQPYNPFNRILFEDNVDDLGDDLQLPPLRRVENEDHTEIGIP